MTKQNEYGPRITCPECGDIGLNDGELCPRCSAYHRTAACRLLLQWACCGNIADPILGKAIEEAKLGLNVRD